MAITLNGTQEKLRALEGKPRTTPIRMSELNNRIDSIQNTGFAEEYKFAGKSRRFLIPEKYRNGYNFLLVSGTFQGRNYYTITLNRNANPVVHNALGTDSFDFRVVKVGNEIHIDGRYDVTAENLVLLFYK